MPFTPRWLIHHNREEEGRRTLAKLRNMPVDHELIELEFLEIKAQSIFEKRTIAANFPQLSQPSAWNTVKLQFVAIASLFKTMPMFRRVIVATVIMFFQQWTGISESSPRSVTGLLDHGSFYPETMSWLHQTSGVPDTGLEY